MVDDPRPPAALDPLPGRRDAAAGLAGDDDDANRTAGRPVAPSRSARHVQQSQRVGRGAAHHRRGQGLDRGQSLPARHAAGGNRMRPDLRRRVESCPEAEERPEREGEEHAVAGRDARRAVHRLPALEHPLPGRRRIDPAQGLAGCRRRLVVARVVLQRFGQRRSPGWRRGLVGHQLGFRGERQRGQVPGECELADIDAGAGELAVVEGIPAPQSTEKSREPFRLQRLEHRARFTLAFRCAGRRPRRRRGVRRVAVVGGHASGSGGATAKRPAISRGITVDRSGASACLAMQAMVRLPVATAAASFVTCAV